MAKLRLLFTKEAQASYISHLDTMQTFQRVFPRAELHLKHSNGFHPHPIISIVLPLPVGQSSECELLDFEVTQASDGCGIAEKLNMYTAAPVNQTKTVSFPLVLSADGTQMSNATVMLFPSSAKPMFKLIIKLKNGNTKVYQQPLNAPLKANNKLTLTLTLGDIFSEETSGGFTIDNWQEENETIDIPTLE